MDHLTPGRRRRRTPAERMCRLAELELCQSPLTAEETEDLREVYDGIVRVHHERIRAQLLRRGVQPEAVPDIVQEVFLLFFRRTVEQGFPKCVPAMLHKLAGGLRSNHLRDERNDPVSVGLPSSGSAPAPSGPGAERAVDLKAVGAEILRQLSPEELDLVDMCIFGNVSHTDAAETLGIPLGTVKSRLRSAKMRMKEAAQRKLPPSQQEVP